MEERRKTSGEEEERLGEVEWGEQKEDETGDLNLTLRPTLYATSVFS